MKCTLRARFLRYDRKPSDNERRTYDSEKSFFPSQYRLHVYTIETTVSAISQMFFIHNGNSQCSLSLLCTVNPCWVVLGEVFPHGSEIRHYERRNKFQMNRYVPRRAELLLDVVLFENGRKPLLPTTLRP